MTAFDQAWEVVKMPVHLEHKNKRDEDDYGNLSVHGPIWQGRRAGMRDTGYWTPHKDKALAYALFGTRYDWAGGNQIDARESIPELYRYDPGEHDIHLPADEDYMSSDTINRALALRRVAFKDDYGDIASGEIGADLENDGIYPEKISDNELADMIERLHNSKDWDEGEAYQSGDKTNYFNLFNLEQSDPRFSRKEWKRIFGTNPAEDWDNISDSSRDNYDYYHEGFVDHGKPYWDLSVVDGLKGGNLMNLVNNLRGRGE